MLRATFHCLTITLLVTIATGNPFLQTIEEFNLDLITAACYDGIDYSIIGPRIDNQSFKPQDCSPIIMDAKAKFNDLVINYNKIISNTYSSSEQSELKKSFDSLIEKIRQLFAKFLLENKNRETEMESIEQEFNIIINEMKKNIKIIEDNPKDHSEANIIEMCESITEIIDKKMENILKELKKVNENDQYVAIVRKSYGGNIDNLKYLANFLTKMSHYDIRAFEALYEEMDKNNDLMNPQLIHFYFNVKEIISSTNFKDMSAEDKNRFQILKKALEFSANQIIELLGNQIRCDALEKSEEKAFDFSTFEHILHRIVRSAYQNNLHNFQNVLKFVKELSDDNLKLIGFTALFNEMKENDQLDTSEIIQLAYTLKETIGCTKSKDLKQKFELLKELFPEGVNLIIWNRVCLRNIKDKHEYLYPFWQVADIKQDNKTLLSWLPNDGQFKEGYWEFKAVDGGKYFNIENDYYKESICSSTLSLYHDNIGHRVFTRRDLNLIPNSFKWTIKEKKDSVFTIRNLHNNEFLYASRDTFDHQRRYVFTWKNARLDDADIFWKIEAC